MSHLDAVQRISFELTYGYTTERHFAPDYLFGPNIPNAYNPAIESVGDWCCPDTPQESTFPNWVRHYMHAVVAEAIHEALEWYKVDGKALLDPHGFYEGEIHDLSAEVGERLWEMVDPKRLEEEER